MSLEPSRRPSPLAPVGAGVAAGVVVLVILLLVAGAVAGVIGGLVAGGLVYAGMRRRLPAPAPPRQVSHQEHIRGMHGDVRRLAPGDVVNYESVDWIVDRTMTFDEDGFSWQEHMLVDHESGRKLWLSVEDDDGLEVAVFERQSGVELDPDARSLTHEGVTYTREERGRARFTTRDASGQVENGAMEYADYRAGERVLGLERYGSASTWEVSTGKVVSEHELDIYPAGQR